jgi:hypothetical protein
MSCHVRSGSLAAILAPLVCGPLRPHNRTLGVPVLLHESIGGSKRFSGFSHARQCGDDVLRMLVTGGPPARAAVEAFPAHGYKLGPVRCCE